MKHTFFLTVLIVTTLISCNKPIDSRVINFYPSGDTLCILDTLGKDLDGTLKFYKEGNILYSTQEWKKGALKKIIVFDNNFDTLMFNDVEKDIYVGENTALGGIQVFDSTMLSVYQNYMYFEIDSTQMFDKKYIVRIKNIPVYINSYILKPWKVGYIMMYGDHLLMKIKSDGEYYIKCNSKIIDNFYIQHFNTTTLPNN
jgi:hypothetical protein